MGAVDALATSSGNAMTAAGGLSFDTSGDSASIGNNMKIGLSVSALVGASNAAKKAADTMGQSYSN